MAPLLVPDGTQPLRGRATPEKLAFQFVNLTLDKALRYTERHCETCLTNCRMPPMTVSSTAGVNGVGVNWCTMPVRPS